MTVVIGEVHTALLQASGAVPPDVAAELLAVVPGERTRLRERPVRHARSPDVLTGVDCDALTGRRQVRVVGTMNSHLSLTGGHLLQAATRVRIQPGTAGRRQPWSHYLVRPGDAELLTGAGADDLAGGFLGRAGDDLGATAPGGLDLHGVNTRLISAVQRDERLDRQPPLRTRRTRLRWAARPGRDGAQRAVFTVSAEGHRTLDVQAPVDDVAALEAFCADLALHDWLLTSLVDVVDRAFAGHRPPAEVLERLRPAIDHLVHVWMPGVRVSDALAGLWDELERRSRLSLQWQTTVARIRDHVSLGMIGGRRDTGAGNGGSR